MPLTAEERQALRRYLLGEELCKEQDRIEEAYFSKDAYFQEFLDVERELMEDYWRGRLTPAERGAVEVRLLTRPGLREVDRVVRTLRAVPRLRAAPRPMWRYAFAGTSLLLAVSTGALLVQNNRLRDELALRPRLERGPVIAVFTLQGGADRLSGGMPTFTVPPEAG